jgi:DNA repair protein RadC
MSEGVSTVLFVRDQSGAIRGATATEIIAAARQALSRRVRRGAVLTSPRLVRDFLSVKLGALEHESFAVLLLDNRHRLIDYVELFRGTIDGASVHPREVVKLALAPNAAAVVLAHPHPSGAP